MSPCSLLFVLLSFLLLLPTSALALAPFYEAFDLSEGPGDPDRWEYRYQIDLSGWAGISGAAGFSIYFPVEEAQNLTTTGLGPGADWDILVLQPDPILPAHGVYDAFALSPSPATGSGFAVAFDWFGKGTPGPQAFEVYDGFFSAVESGVTVPEPGTALLVAAGLSVFGVRSRRPASVRPRGESR